MTTSFYNPSEVRSMAADEINSAFSDAQSISGSVLFHLDEENAEKKQSLNKTLFGNAETRFRVVNVKPNSKNLADAFPLAVRVMRFFCEKAGFPAIGLQALKHNRLTSGEKLSRVLLRKLSHVQNESIFTQVDFYLQLYMLRKELKNLPRESEQVSLSVFVQNFFSAFASYRSRIVITTAFWDMITASEFTGGWSSCNGLGGGYGSSSIVRALDKQSAMVFLCNENSTNKVGRFWVTFSPDQKQFITYPTYGDFSDASQDIACNIIKKAISQNLNLSGTWEEAGYFRNNFSATGRTGAYIDTAERHFYHESQGQGFNIHWPQAVCLSCGEKHQDNESLCESCRDDRPICADCGERVSHDYACYDEPTDNYYCEYCYDRLFTTCDDCGEWLRKDSDDFYTIRGREYCESCYCENVTACHECGDDTLNEDMEYVESVDGHVCRYCRDKHYSTCDDCGEVFHKNSLHTRGRYDLCDDCLESALEDADFTAECVFHDMFKDNDFFKIQNATFPRATPAIIKPVVGDYVILDEKFIYSNSYLYELAVNKTPLLVTYVYREQCPTDNDVRIMHPEGVGRMVQAEALHSIASKEYVFSYFAHHDAEKAFFDNDAFRSMDDMRFPRASWQYYSAGMYSIGDKVILKAWNDISLESREAHPNTNADMHRFFDGETGRTIREVIDHYDGRFSYRFEGIDRWVFAPCWFVGN